MKRRTYFLDMERPGYLAIYTEGVIGGWEPTDIPDPDEGSQGMDGLAELNRDVFGLSRRDTIAIVESTRLRIH